MYYNGKLPFYPFKKNCFFPGFYIISTSIFMHKILLEENAKTSIEHQRRLNPVIKEVLKWWNAGFIYAISCSHWVSPVHVVPKKG